MPLFPERIPAPIFDSDESDAASQQSNDSCTSTSSLISSQFNQLLPLLPLINFDDSIELNSSTTRKRKRNNNQYQTDLVQTPNQSPYSRQRNLDYVQEHTLQSPKTQRRTIRQYNPFLTISTSPLIPSNIVNLNPFLCELTKPRYHTRLVAKRQTSLRQLVIKRYEHEFHHESYLGYGEFSHVYLCTNRLDGLNYAIKTSKQTILGTPYEQIAYREICAYSILASHENLVRYYSAWIEPDGKFYLQLEYCNGGSLDDVIEKNRQENHSLSEQDLKLILHQISDILTYMHKNNLAHLDIKPSNIMICQYSDTDITYKLTDLGHVSQISSCQIDEDGDSRYLALEILQQSNKKKINLDKCDIFSLGLTLYVCGTNYHMPKQGNEWQQLRLNISQYLYPIGNCTKEFNQLLIERMCNIDPNRRPTAYDLLLDPIVISTVQTSRLSLQHCLKHEREKNVLLNKKLLDQYIIHSTDVHILSPLYSNEIYLPQQCSLSPAESNIVPQQQTLTPNNNSRILSIHTPNTLINLNQTITSPINCGLLAMKQQVKLAGSNMFRYYSSII